MTPSQIHDWITYRANKSAELSNQNKRKKATPVRTSQESSVSDNKSASANNESNKVIKQDSLSKNTSKKHTKSTKDINESNHIRKLKFPKFPRRVNSAYKRAKRQQCYKESEPVSDDTLGPLIKSVTAHTIHSRYGDIVKYQHVMNPPLAQPRIDKSLLKYLNWLWRRQFRLSANDIKQMSQLKDLQILLLTSAAIPVRVKRVIADAGSSRYNHLLQKIEKQIENDVHSRTTEEAVNALANNTVVVNRKLNMLIMVHQKQNAKMHRMLLATNALLTNLFIRQSGGANAMDVKNLRVKLSSDTVLNAIIKENGAADDLISNYQHRRANTGRESKNYRRRNRG